jgi:hypothetical protein
MVPWLTPPTIMPTMHDITEIVVTLVQQEPITLPEHLCSRSVCSRVRVTEIVVTLVQQEPIILPEHLCSRSVCSRVRVAQS